MNSNDRVELRAIEGLRLVASVAIMVSHFAPYAARNETWGDGLRIFVDVFFVISGIVICTAYHDRVGSAGQYGLYLQRRFARLYPLHAATMVFYLGVAAAASAGLFRVVNPDRYDLGQLPYYFTMTHAWFGNGRIAWNGVSWSISAELFVYLLFPLLLYAIRGSVVRSAIVTTILLITCAVVADIRFERSVLAIQTQCSWLRAIPSFAFGVALALHRHRLGGAVAQWSDRVAYPLLVLLVASALLGWPDPLKLVLTWGAVAFVYAGDLDGRPSLLGHKRIADQGRLTYSLYLIHPIFATTWLAFLAPKLGFHGSAMWAAVLIAIAATFIVSHFSFVYFEEPMRRLLGRPMFGTRRQSAHAS
ncbi:hypothetical protein DMC47_28080 [Nostoc sp. 3335mG]|nr:hypothetical protein DMC47_28080 [Nostoc sp. 3335mG]